MSKVSHIHSDGSASNKIDNSKYSKSTSNSSNMESKQGNLSNINQGDNSSNGNDEFNTSKDYNESQESDINNINSENNLSDLKSDNSKYSKSTSNSSNMESKQEDFPNINQGNNSSNSNDEFNTSKDYNESQESDINNDINSEDNISDSNIDNIKCYKSTSNSSNMESKQEDLSNINQGDNSSNGNDEFSTSKDYNESQESDINNDINSENSLSNSSIDNSKYSKSTSNNSNMESKQEDFPNIIQDNNSSNSNDEFNTSKEYNQNQESDINNDKSSSNNDNISNEQSKRKELLKKLSNKLKEYKERQENVDKIKKEHLNSEKKDVEKSYEEKYELTDQTNQFLDELKELPSFDERNRGAGYSIDNISNTDVPESVIKTLISKFLNQRFCNHSTDLNSRSNSLEKSKGFYKWEVKDVITHLKTHQITKVLTDKYGYQYAEGKNEFIPLSFYFDLSGSMSKYTNMLAVIAIELLKKDVKVLIGFNERVNVQIDKIDRTITLEELVSVIESAGYWGDNDNLKKNSKVTYKFINRNIDNYLIEKKAEKCVVFADFDPLNEVINLSQKVDTYWFCFENSFTRRNISNFNGFIYKVTDLKDLENGLVKVNQKRFETLCYTDNPDVLQKKVRVKK